MAAEWLSTTWTTVALVALSTVAIFLAVVVSARILGLRTFSKMSSFDFSVTVATGSIIASIAVTSASLANGLVGLAVLLTCQYITARLRRDLGLGWLFDNTPLLLVDRGELLPDNLTAARVTADDVYAKLREANCLRLADAYAVVLETTGDISVMHGGDGIDDVLLEGVRR